MGQAISEFGVTRPSFFNPPPNEDMYRRLQLTMDYLHNFQEHLVNIIASPSPHREPLSALLPRLSDSTPPGYRSLSMSQANPSFISPV